jgi:hypothetical protein
MLTTKRLDTSSLNFEHPLVNDTYLYVPNEYKANLSGNSILKSIVKHLLRLIFLMTYILIIHMQNTIVLKNLPNKESTYIIQNYQNCQIFVLKTVSLNCISTET